MGSLEKQAREKRQRESEDRQRHEAFGERNDEGCLSFILSFFAAQEMIRHDKVVELLQQRQEKDLKQLNKVSVCVYSIQITITNMLQAGIKLLSSHPAVSNRIS